MQQAWRHACVTIENQDDGSDFIDFNGIRLLCRGGFARPCDDIDGHGCLA
jgi:hypothetical protein